MDDNMNYGHGHIVTSCRHCDKTEHIMVLPTMAECSRFFNNFYATYKDAPEYKENPIEVIKYDDDLWRMKIGPHDLIVTTMPCADEYERCSDTFAKMSMNRLMQIRLQEKMDQLMGEGGMNKIGEILQQIIDEGPEALLRDPDPQGGTPPVKKPVEFNDRSTFILNQIDFPEDFMS